MSIKCGICVLPVVHMCQLSVVYVFFLLCTCVNEVWYMCSSCCAHVSIKCGICVLPVVHMCQLSVVYVFFLLCTCVN